MHDKKQRLYNRLNDENDNLTQDVKKVILKLGKKFYYTLLNILSYAIVILGE